LRPHTNESKYLPHGVQFGACSTVAKHCSLQSETGVLLAPKCTGRSVRTCILDERRRAHDERLEQLEDAHEEQGEKIDRITLLLVTTLVGVALNFFYMVTSG